MTALQSLSLLFLSGKLLSLLLWPWNQTAALALFFAIDAVVAWNIIAPSAQGLGSVVTGFKTKQREVWLTIDDGPDPDDTPQILALLAHHRAKATFFVIGQRAEKYPHLISAIKAAGHEIAHHTHTHPIWSLWAAGPRRFRDELDRTLHVLTKLGVTPTRYRNPGGSKCLFQEKNLSQRQLTNVAWSIRSWDTVLRNPDAIVRRIMSNVLPGSIILMHEGASVTKRARLKSIARLLVRLEASGYQCVIPANSLLC